MRKIKSIAQVDNLYIIDNVLIYKENKNIIINSFKNEINSDDYITTCYNNIIRTNSDKKEVYVWSKNDFILLSNHHTSVCFKNKELYILIDYDYEGECTLYQANMNKNVYQLKTKGFKNIIHFNSNSFWVSDMFEKSNISCISFQNVILWHYMLPEGFKIFGQVQVVNNVLLFYSFKNGNEEKFVAGLNIQTGEVLWQHFFKIPYEKRIMASVINSENNLCYGYLGDLYQIFNPTSGEIILEKRMSADVNPYVNSIYDNKLWFVSGKYESCKFGYINLKTNEIELLQDFPQETDEQFDEPVFHEGKLYLRGVHYNNLYIFE